MIEVCGTLTVFFEGPFWVGVFERTTGNGLSVCKVTFGAEPKESEVFDFVLRKYGSLAFSSAVRTEVRKPADNPKRRQRNARRQIQSSGIGTKSQQVLQLQREEMRIVRKQNTKEEKEAEKQRRFDLKQQKRKEKHKGH